MRGFLIPAVSLMFALSIFGSGPASAELIPGGWLMPPRVPQAVPAPAPRPVPKAVVPASRKAAQPQKRTQPARQQPMPPSDGKVRF